MDQNKLRVNLEDSEPIVCENCGNDLFILVVYLRKFSKILVGSTEDFTYPYETFACSKCNHVNLDRQLPIKQNNNIIT